MAMKKRVKLAVVGSASISVDSAKKLALSILSDVEERWTISLLITIREDPIGRALRKLVKARAKPVARKTYSDEKNSSQSSADELTAGDVFWSTTNYIVIHNGDSSWAEHISVMLERHGRRYKLLEIDRE